MSANIVRESCHWYAKNGAPAYTQPNKTKGGERPTTLRDAKALGLLPSVTTILGCMSKPGLDLWKQKNAIHAALTTPRLPDENEDAFCERILSEDVHSISDAAKERGTLIHGAIEQVLSGRMVESILGDLQPFVSPVIEACKQFGAPISCEKTIVGNGYAGKVDAVFQDGDRLTVIDFKTATTMPKDSYFEHKMQTAAYKAAISLLFKGKTINTANIYIQSNEPNKIAVFIQQETKRHEMAFMALFEFWKLLNNYNPLDSASRFNELKGEK